MHEENRKNIKLPKIKQYPSMKILTEGKIIKIYYSFWQLNIFFSPYVD